MSNFIDLVDMYGISANRFNFEGRRVIGSKSGASISILIYVITGLFSILKFYHLLASHNPKISNGKLEGQFISNENALPVSDNGFMIGFQVSDFQHGNVLDAPNLVRWEINLVESDGISFDGEPRALDYHKCSEEDWNHFYTPSRANAKKFRDMKEADNLYCIDDIEWKGKKLELYG
jgi:hypothetical protein